MAGCKISLFVLATFCTFLAVYSLPPLHGLSKRSGTRLCGKNLVQALALVCDSFYYTPNNYEKRNYNDVFGERTYVMKGKGKPLTTTILDKTTTDLSSTESFERDARGIIDECCKKSCTVYDLAAYCN